MAGTSKILDDKHSDVGNHHCVAPVVLGLACVLEVGVVLVQGLVRVQLQDVAEELQQG